MAVDVVEKEVAAEMNYFLRGSQHGAGGAELHSSGTNAQRMHTAVPEEEAAAEANHHSKEVGSGEVDLPLVTPSTGRRSH